MTYGSRKSTIQGIVPPVLRWIHRPMSWLECGGPVVMIRSGRSSSTRWRTRFLILRQKKIPISGTIAFWRSVVVSDFILDLKVGLEERTDPGGDFVASAGIDDGGLRYSTVTLGCRCSAINSGVA